MRSRSINVWRSAHPPLGTLFTDWSPSRKSIDAAFPCWSSSNSNERGAAGRKTRSRCAPEPGIESPYRNTRTDSPSTTRNSSPGPSVTG